METLEIVEKFFSIGNSTVVIIGLPIAIIQFRSARKKEQADRQKEQADRQKEQQDRLKEHEQHKMQTYQNANDRYWEFQMLCMDHPDLDVFDFADKWGGSKDNAKRQELIAFNMLLSLFERVFLLHTPTKTEFRQEWSGWNELISLYCGRENFQQAWQKLGYQWDRDFLKYINEKMPEGMQTKPD